MRLSDLGLPPEDVNKIVSDLLQTEPTPTTAVRTPEAPKALQEPQPQQAVIRVNEATPAIDNTKSKDVGVSLVPPGKATLPPSVIPVGVQPPGAEKKSGAGLILAAAGAGFLVGGPVGAAVGAGAGWLLGKGSTPAPVPTKQPLRPMTQASPPQTIVAPPAALAPTFTQVTPTSTKAPTAAPLRTDMTIKTSTASRLVASRLPISITSK